EGEIAEGREAKRERDGNADGNERADQQYKEDQQVDVAERHQKAAQQHRRHGNDHRSGDHRHRDLRIRIDQPHDRDDEHQDQSDRYRRDDERPWNVERRRQVDGFLQNKRVARGHQLERERDHHNRSDRVEDLLLPQRPAAVQRRQAHVLAAAIRDHGTEHRQPQEQDRRHLVGPDDRVVQDVPRKDAARENADLDDEEDGRDRLDDGTDRTIDRRRPAAPQPRRRGDDPLALYFSDGSGDVAQPSF